MRTRKKNTIGTCVNTFLRIYIKRGQKVTEPHTNIESQVKNLSVETSFHIRNIEIQISAMNFKTDLRNP